MRFANLRVALGAMMTEQPERPYRKTTQIMQCPTSPDPQWGVDMPEGKIAGVWFTIERSSLLTGDGKNASHTIVPVMALEFDEGAPVRHREFIWSEPGTTAACRYPLELIGVYPLPGPAPRWLVLHEIMLPEEFRTSLPQGSNDPAPVAGEVDGR